jgi:hypothetical protein
VDLFGLLLQDLFAVGAEAEKTFVLQSDDVLPAKINPSGNYT